MSGDVEAMVERLSDEAALNGGAGAYAWRARSLCGEAAAMLRSQQVEIERLREALTEIVDNCGQCGGYGTYPEEETVTGKVLWSDCSSPQCRSARAALAGGTNDAEG